MIRLCAPVPRVRLATWGILCVLSFSASAEDFSYQGIAARYPDQALESSQVAAAQMQGECLVGLKTRNFQPKHSFDPVAEWSSVRTSQLLQQHAPCEVLIMIEVAQDKQRKTSGE